MAGDAVHLVIDGYNVMHALPGGAEWPGSSFQARRGAFLNALSRYARGRSAMFTVVFDGAKGGDAFGGAEYHGAIRVLYSPRGVQADELIRDLVDRAERPRDCLVVTSDKPVSAYARHRGASVARSDELVNRLRETASPRGDEVPPSAAARFEREVKGYRNPERPSPRRRPASRCRHRLW